MQIRATQESSISAARRVEAANCFREAQEVICRGLAAADGSGEFGSDLWERPDGHGGSGGGGCTRVLANGAIFESAGVNFSEVFGELSSEMSQALIGETTPQPFYATGVSLVLHPFSPMVPTVHANFRYIEVGPKCWYGGGADLTPYYLFEEDAAHFHGVWQDVCGAERYREYKAHCDRYFYIPHRGESRGVGGIFYDYLGRDDPQHIAEYSEFSSKAAAAFLSCYLPIVARRRDQPWSEAEKRFQLLRRGRYAEFNLVYDRGTQFGLKTNGRTESILMSLPPTACWEYGFTPTPGSREAALIQVLQTPREWV